MRTTTKSGTTTEHDAMGGGAEPPSALAGSLLRAGREAAGLTIDAVAQQLKLAPRQVQALEDGDYTHLPGRTFIRGFMRNYARLVKIDADSVLRALPAATATPALDTPMLQPTAPTMGELPAAERNKPGWGRWAIPLSLAAIVAAAAAYEWLRPAEPRVAAVKAANGTEHPTPAKQEAPGTALLNPLAPSEGAAVAPGAPTPGSPPATQAPVSAPAVVAPAASVPEAPAPTGAMPSTASASPAIVANTEAAAADQPLIIAFRDYSWTEVRDRRGRVLLSGFNTGGTSQTLNGTPPLDVVIGNASEVSVRYKGQPFDLAPYTRQNVARFTLP